MTAGTPEPERPMAFLLRTYGEEIGVYPTHVDAIEGARKYVAEIERRLRAEEGIEILVGLWPSVRWVYDPTTGGSHTTDLEAARLVDFRNGRPRATDITAMFDIAPL